MTFGQISYLKKKKTVYVLTSFYLKSVAVVWYYITLQALASILWLPWSVTWVNNLAQSKKSQNRLRLNSADSRPKKLYLRISLIWIRFACSLNTAYLVMVGQQSSYNYSWRFSGLLSSGPLISRIVEGKCFPCAGMGQSHVGLQCGQH